VQKAGENQAPGGDVIPDRTVAGNRQDTWVKEMKTRIKIELPQFCTTKKEQIKGFEMLIMLRT